MGVKGLWGYLEHHHVVYEYPSRSSQKNFEKNGIPYALRPEHLFVDMNAVLHTSYSAKKPTTKDTLIAVYAHLEEILRRVQPSVSMVLVFDGPAPHAKITEQKQRRCSLPCQAPSLGPATATATAGPRRDGDEAPLYTCDLVRKAVPLRTEEIVTGSEFVYACEEVAIRFLQDAATKGLRTWKRELLSRSSEPGEGEVKISRYIRHLYETDLASGAYKDDDAITIIGNDSDLVIVSMCAIPYRFFTLMDPCDYGLTSISELLTHWAQAVPNPPLPDAILRSYRIDFAFLMLLAGCDYYEGVRNTAINLWRVYRDLRANKGYFRRPLIHGPTFEVDAELLRRILARDGPLMAHVVTSKSKRASAKAQLRGGTQGSAEDGLLLLRAALWNLKGYVCGGCVDYGFRVHQNGQPSVGSLRAAVQRSGLGSKMGAGFVAVRSKGGMQSASNGTKTVAAVEPVVVTSTENKDAEHEAELGAVSDESRAPLTALGHCVAVLGVRGHFSPEVVRAIRACTSDDGAKLTTGTSANALVSTARSVVAELQRARLTRAEQALAQWGVDALGEPVKLVPTASDAVFMTLARPPPAPPRPAKREQSDAQRQEQLVDSAASDTDSDGDEPVAALSP